jgi:hypothetical protein
MWTEWTGDVDGITVAGVIPIVASPLTRDSGLTGRVNHAGLHSLAAEVGAGGNLHR